MIILILLYKVKRLCLMLKILITSQPTEFSIYRKFDIGPMIVYDYFIFRFKSWDSFGLYFISFATPLIVTLEADRQKKKHFIFNLKGKKI